MDDEDAYSDTSPCSYCGAAVYGDSPRCPACGNYTDGLGDFGGKARGADNRLPRIYVFAGWLALIGVLTPFLIALYDYYLRFVKH